MLQERSSPWVFVLREVGRQVSGLELSGCGVLGARVVGRGAGVVVGLAGRKTGSRELKCMMELLMTAQK